jgi:hypothetical protein
MNEKSKANSYARGPETRQQNAPYDQKFAGFIRAVEKGKTSDTEYLIIAEPWVIGDTYEEIIESLSRLAGTNLALRIAHRKDNAANN